MKTTMMIRNMTIDDYEEVYNLWLKCGGFGLNDVDDSKEGIKRYLDRNPDTCFVVIEDNKIIGAVLSGHDGRRGYINHTSIDPDYRLKGIGRKLIERVIESLRDKKITKININVASDNEEGNIFWEKMGFKSRDYILKDKILIDYKAIK